MIHVPPGGSHCVQGLFRTGQAAHRYYDQRIGVPPDPPRRDLNLGKIGRSGRKPGREKEGLELSEERSVRFKGRGEGFEEYLLVFPEPYRHALVFRRMRKQDDAVADGTVNAVTFRYLNFIIERRGIFFNEAVFRDKAFQFGAARVGDKAVGLRPEPFGFLR